MVRIADVARDDRLLESCLILVEALVDRITPHSSDDDDRRYRTAEEVDQRRAFEPVVSFPRTVPDGLAFDAEGGLWIGCYQPNRIYRLTADGNLEVVVDDWTGEYVLSPTNLAFAGEQLEVLVLASLCGWAVKAIDPGVRGAALERPEPGDR